MIDGLNAKLRARKLLRLLDDERALLLAGRLSDLPALCTARDQLFQLIGKSGVAGERALAEYGPQIKARAERNRRLLKAALDGMRMAQTQLSRAAQSAADMQTYTADGKRVQVNSQAPLGGHRT